MPLLKGSSQEIIDQNISEMVNAGHPEDQAVAAAYRSAKKHMQGHATRVKQGVVPAKLKRPSLHPLHPFNSKKSPDNKKADVVPAGGIAPMKAQPPVKPVKQF
jgi:hypothetical protein